MKIKQQSFKPCVIGLGYVGLPICERFSRAGVEVIGVDNDPNKIKDQVNKTQSILNQFKTSTPSVELASKALSKFL